MVRGGESSENSSAAGFPGGDLLFSSFYTSCSRLKPLLFGSISQPFLLLFFKHKLSGL